MRNTEQSVLHGAKLAAKANSHDPDRMTAFSTYQSIQAIHDAQTNFGLH